MSNSQKGKWALVPVGVVATVIATVAAYGQISGRSSASMETLRANVNAITAVLPEIRDRLTAIETDIAWIKRGLDNE